MIALKGTFNTHQIKVDKSISKDERGTIFFNGKTAIF